MPEQFHLSHDGKQIGHVVRDGSRWRLAYAPSWVRGPTSFALSPHLPLRAETFDDTAGDPVVQKYFENLLPSGDALAKVEQLLPNGACDAFKLLVRLGRETPGALCITSSPGEEQSESSYRKLAPRRLAERIEAVQARDGSLLGSFRMLLAGSQDKLALRLDDSGTDGVGSSTKEDVGLALDMLEPLGLAPTTHILKPQPPASARLDHLALNEFFCMRLGRAIGADVPPTTLLSVRSSQEHAVHRVFAVKRFDRTAARQGRTTRLHQVSFMQLRNEWPAKAIQAKGAANADLPLLFELAAKYSTLPAAAIGRLLSQRVLRFLVGNTNVHWKDFSMLCTAGRWDVSPAYNVVCDVPYRRIDSKPSFPMGGCMREDLIEADHFREFYEQCLAPYGAKIQAVRFQLSKMSGAIEAQVQMLYEELAPRLNSNEKAFLRGVLVPAILHRSALANKAAAGLPPDRVVGRRVTR